MMDISTMRLMIGALGAVVVVSSCSSCNKQTATLHPEMTVPIADPWLQKLVAITDKINLKGEGALKGGNYNFAGKTIKVAPGTRFELDLSCLFDGRPEIRTDKVDGHFILDPPVEIDGIPLPTRLTIKQGEATVEMDFGRALFALIVSGLQQHQSIDAGEGGAAALKNLPEKIVVSEARLDLKPDTQLDLTSLSARVAGGSFIAIRDVAYTSATSYQAKLAMDLKLKEGSELNWGNVRCDTRLGELLLNANLDATEGNITATTFGLDKNCRLTLAGCSVKLAEVDDKSKSQSSPESHSEAVDKKSVDAQASRIELSLSKLAISKPAGSASPPDVNLLGCAELVDSKLALSSNSDELAFVLPEKTTADLTASLSKAGAQDISLKIEDGLQVRNFSWRSTRGDNQFGIDLREVSINQLNATSATGIEMVLDAVAIRPERLSWKSKGATVDLSLDPQSKIVSTTPLCFAYDGTKLEAPLVVPLRLSAGSVSIKDRQNNIYKLKDVEGDCKVSTSNDDLHLDSTMKLKVSSNANLLGIHGLRGEIGKLTISGSAKHARLDLAEGKVLLALEDVKNAIKNNLPDRTVVNVNETLQEKTKWRYRNFKLKKIVARHPRIERLEIKRTDEIAVAADADLSLAGTVEVYHQKFNPLSKTPSQWKEHEWTADAHVNESGVVDYRLVPGASLADSKIHLDTKIDVHYPERLSIDLSKIADDALAKAENQVLQMALKAAKSLTQNKSSMIKYSGDLPLVRSADRRLKAIKVSNFKVSPSGKNLLIQFAGRVEL